jgi:hypothetical protein
MLPFRPHSTNGGPSYSGFGSEHVAPRTVRQSLMIGSSETGKLYFSGTAVVQPAKIKAARTHRLIAGQPRLVHLHRHDLGMPPQLTTEASERGLAPLLGPEPALARLVVVSPPLEWALESAAKTHNRGDSEVAPRRRECV